MRQTLQTKFGLRVKKLHSEAIKHTFDQLMLATVSVLDTATQQI